MKNTLLACLLGLACAASGAKVVEEVADVPVTAVDMYGKSVTQPIKVTIFRDDEAPRAPFLVLSHGRPANPDEFATMGRQRFSENSRYFVTQGFVVLVPTRIGYGPSRGEDVETTGSGARRNYLGGFAAAADETVGVIAYARALPYVDADRGVLVGQSFGGAATMAVAARNEPGIVAAINFAGGGGGNPITRPGDPWRPDLLEKTFAAYGQTAKVPSLWLYSENDKFFGAVHPRRWFEAYQRGQADASFIALPPLPVELGDDGHKSFLRHPEAWRPAVEAFLRRTGFRSEGSERTRGL